MQTSKKKDLLKGSPFQFMIKQGDSVGVRTQDPQLRRLLL